MTLCYRSLTAVAAAVLLIVPAAHADQASVPVPSLANAMSGFGEYTIPAAWAGVWNFQDSDYDCKTNVLIDTFADTDTLCSGQVIYDDPKFSCSGSVNNTHIDIECSVTFPFDEGCSATFTFTLDGMRTGDTANVTSTFSQEFTPTMCAFLPDSCTRTETVMTRIAPEPPNCLTAVEPATWGQLKAVYR